MLVTQHPLPDFSNLIPIMIDSLATSADSAAASHSTGSPSESASQPLDPRIRRTRELLQQALDKLLETNEFEKISVQDITDAATVNRATFYAHYPDKFALLAPILTGQPAPAPE
jgi:AcrR family transcriptional regulator